MLKQRVITALVLLPIALGGFFWLHGAAFALFIGAVITLGAWEWARLAGFAGAVARLTYAAAVALLLLALYHLPMLAPVVLLLAVLWWLAATWLVIGYPASSRYWGQGVGKLVIGLLILLPAWQGLVLLKQWPQANWLIIAVMVLVWGADIGAYFSGRALGKRKLAPAVSPGKSWEGAISGLLGVLVLRRGDPFFRFLVDAGGQAAHQVLDRLADGHPAAGGPAFLFLDLLQVTVDRGFGAAAQLFAHRIDGRMAPRGQQFIACAQHFGFVDSGSGHGSPLYFVP